MGGMAAVPGVAVFYPNGWLIVGSFCRWAQYGLSASLKIWRALSVN